MEVVYEDNHIVIVAKQSGEIVQGDKTGDEPLSEKVKAYLKEKYQKPGAVFLGVVHRLDRPVGGLVMFARTSKALARLNKMFANGEVHKTYWAIVESDKSEVKSGKPSIHTSHLSLFTSHLECHLLEHWLTRNERQNKSYAHDHEVAGSKLARLRCRLLAQGDHYALVEVQLMTGRHHQIRCQLSAIGCPIKGDLKYGARRSNADGSISLLARRIAFIHPVSGADISIETPLPADPLWQALAAKAVHQTSPQTPA
ncbi:MAG: RluA family pseudouridine synthase [Prevotella sp.]|nr:RluA family pseudouridine synthase [Prevotella sp.]